MEVPEASGGGPWYLARNLGGHCRKGALAAGQARDFHSQTTGARAEACRQGLQRRGLWWEENAALAGLCLCLIASAEATRDLSVFPAEVLLLPDTSPVSKK